MSLVGRSMVRCPRCVPHRRLSDVAVDSIAPRLRSVWFWLLGLNCAQFSFVFLMVTYYPRLPFSDPFQDSYPFQDMPFSDPFQDSYPFQDIGLVWGNLKYY
jgi:hypothetical protein